MNVLVVEDEKRLADALKEILCEQRYHVDVVYDGEDGYFYGRSGIYDCIVLDVMLPKKTGFEVLTSLRAEKITTPILILTARDTMGDKLKGLDLGADDYMTKPFSPEELLARIRVITRRKGEVVLDKLEFADISYDLSSAELSISDGSKRIRLSFKEAEILKLFLSYPNLIHSKEEILTKVWGYDTDVGDNNVEVFISFLRKKLSFIGAKTEIVSIKKIGYKLEEKE